MNYLEIEIRADSSGFEDICNVLYPYGIENILEEENSMKFYIEEEKAELVEEIKNELSKKFNLSGEDFSVRKFEDKNWNSEWEKTIEPVYVKDRIIVYPSWKKEEVKEEEGKILIEIDPKMSFGTGHNETTQLVLEMISDYVTGEEDSMLDFGCGTAVLAIAGIKMGVKSSVAIDIDDDSIENAGEYIALNDTADSIKLYKESITGIQETDFEIVCANIIRSVILENLKSINEKLITGGKLFISGILIEEEEEIIRALESSGFEIKEVLKKSEWLGIYAVKKQ